MKKMAKMAKMESKETPADEKVHSKGFLKKALKMKTAAGKKSPKK